MTNSILTRPAAVQLDDARTVRSVTPTRPALKPSAKSASAPKVVVRAKLISYPQTRRHARAHRAETVVFNVLMFLFIAVTAYGISSIAGQVAVEKSRREELSARERARKVLQMEAVLKSDLVELTRPDKIDEWAKANQFENAGVPVTPKVESPRSTLVAFR